MDKIKLLIVEDHSMTRLGLKFAIEQIEGIEVVGESDNGKKGVELAKQLLPNVILMDIGLPEMDGIEATKEIKNAKLDTKVLIYTSRDCDDDVFAAFEAGADGYIMKGANEHQLANAITAVSSGIAWLDPAIAKLVLSNISKPNQKEEVRVTPVDNSLKYKKYDLTKREYEILCLIADGLDNDELAEKLVIETSTVKQHVHNILGKLYVPDKHRAVVLAYKEGLVDVKN